MYTPPEVFLEKDVLKICSKFIGEHQCRSAISIKLQISFIEITLWHVCSAACFQNTFSQEYFLVTDSVPPFSSNVKLNLLGLFLLFANNLQNKLVC